MGYIARLEGIKILMLSFNPSFYPRNYKGKRLNFKKRLIVVNIIAIPSILMSKVL